MDKRKPIETSKELVEAFASLFDEVEISEEEVDEILTITGHDSAEVGEKIKAFADQLADQYIIDLRHQRDELLGVCEMFLSTLDSDKSDITELIYSARKAVARTRGGGMMDERDFDLLRIL